MNLYMKCISMTPIPGWQLDIDNDCNAKVAKASACPSTFVSYKGMPNKVITKQANLSQNEKCTITLDATDSVARVSFIQPGQEANPTLGVLVPGYVNGQPITVQKGDVRKITLFNGNPSSALQFYITYSGATSLATAAATVLSYSYVL